MQTIQATVNPRLLTKANRLFTGTLQGRIIEILQNARRAGATKVEITNQDGHVNVRDNGGGIDDFAKLLDLGGSGWDDALESSEDPAGVGLFCLAPRQVTIRSNGKKVTISGDAWIGEPVEIEDDAEPIEGTMLCFPDEPWTSSAVDINAVFCGMQVTVDTTLCPSDQFISDQATVCLQLGCRIEVRESSDLKPWHNSCRRGSYYSDNVLVNFHGQVISFSFHEIGEHHLHYLVDLTGAPTDIRLMLPARTRLVENEAFNQLKTALELEGYRYLLRRGHHRLPYKGYLRARELGVNLPEAEPTFEVGLLKAQMEPEPVEVVMPASFPLAKCYRLNPDPQLGDETDDANVHLLTALGKSAEPFVPVHIRSEYDGYSWAKLPTIDKVEFKAGKVLQESWIWSGKISCVDRIEITAHTSDGRAFTSQVCMAIPPIGTSEENRFREDTVYVTPEAQETLAPSNIWFHFGGWSEDSDTYDTQAFEFDKALDEFWALLVGPYEQIRRSLMDELRNITDWKSVTLAANGRMEVVLKNGKRETVKPPRATKHSS